jgi:hypothetical protein
MHDKPTHGKCGSNPADPLLRPSSSISAPRWYAMRHPIIDLICYSIVIAWAVFWGMVVGGTFEQEILRPLAESMDKHPSTPDRQPSPEVFRGVV